MAKRRITYPVYRQPSHITFGTGSTRTLGDPEVATGAVFLISGQEGVRDVLRRAFAKSENTFDEWPVLEKPPGEPTGEAIRIAAEWLSRHPATRLVAVGGGSVPRLGAIGGRRGG